jgi:putative transposase
MSCSTDSSNLLPLVVFPQGMSVSEAMARFPRIDLPGVPQHLMARGNNKARCFYDDHDRQVYLRYLVEAAHTAGCDLHAYVLMSNHVHLLATGHDAGGISLMMQAVGRRFARHVNDVHGRTGTLYEGRFKSSLVETERYFLTCMRYIELNPVRAGMVADPGQFPWSSHRENASGSPSGLLSPHAEYLRLGDDSHARGLAYRALFETPLQGVELAAIRQHAEKNRVLGGEAFQRRIELLLGHPARVVRPGRPRKDPKRGASGQQKVT